MHSFSVIAVNIVISIAEN